LTYWAGVESATRLRKVDAYEAVLSNPRDYVSCVSYLATLLRNTGLPREALALREFEVGLYRANNDEGRLQEALRREAEVLWYLSQSSQALRLLEEQQAICSRLSLTEDLVSCLGDQASILSERGELTEARDKNETALRLARDMMLTEEVALCLSRGAAILHKQGYLAESVRCHLEAEKLFRQLGHVDHLLRSLGDRASVLLQLNDLDGSMKLHHEEERLARALGDDLALQASYGNQALVHMSRGSFSEVEGLLLRQEEICVRLGVAHALQTCIGNQAELARRRGDRSSALELLDKQLLICEEHAYKVDIVRNRRLKALVLLEIGRVEEALKLCDQAIESCQQMGLLNDLQETLGVVALAFVQHGDVEDAITVIDERERVCRSLGQDLGVHKCRSMKEEVSRLRDNPASITDVTARTGTPVVDNQNWEQQASLLILQAQVLRGRGSLKEAKDRLDKAERVCRVHRLEDMLQQVLGHRALLLIEGRQGENALAALREQECIIRKLGGTDPLIRSLGNQAGVLSEMQQKHEDALPLAEEAYRLASDHGYATLAQQIKRLLGSIRAKLG